MATSAVAPPSKKRPSSGVDWDALRARLLGKDAKDALSAAQELKEKIDSVKDFPSASFLPGFSSILTATTRPNSDSTSTEQSLRHIVLEVMSRMPKNDLLRPYAATILETSMDVLSKDYEENALLASKIVFDLHKTFRSGDQVQPYLDFVQTVYRSLPTSVQRNFHFSPEEAPPPPTTAVETPFESSKDASTPSKDPIKVDTNSPSAGIPSTPMTKLAVKSNSSFRVLTECPLTVMLLFQLYPKFLKTNIPTLIQLMMEALTIRAPKIRVEARHKRLYYTRSRELVAAQVKTLSFLTYLLRGFGDQLKPYEDRIATNVVSLMTSCPRESIGTRKELLVATRHILATDFRKGFFRHVDSLLDERILMGSRHADQTMMRPLGYSTLADLVHHVRSMLTLKQLSRVIYMFSRVLHDSSLQLPMTIQITAVRLLLNVVDIIYHNKDSNPQVGRDLLYRILETLVSKLGTLKKVVARVRKAASETSSKGDKSTKKSDFVAEGNKEPNDDLVASKADGGKGSKDDAMEIDLPEKKESTQPTQVDSTSESKVENSNEAGGDKQTGSSCNKNDLISAETWMLEVAKEADSIMDLQTMVRSVVVGLKTVVWCVTNYRMPKEKDKDESSAPRVRLTKSERELVTNYVENAIPCMRIFAPLPGKPLDSMSSSEQQQQRDILTYFSACFTVLDSWNLRRTLGKKIGLVVDAVVDDPNAMVIPRHLLGSNRRTSVEFCDILVGYLVKHIDRLAVPRSEGFVFFSKDPNSEDFENSEKKRKDGKAAILEIEAMSPEALERREKVATAHLELFERVIKSMASFQENETSLRPFLREIVSSSLRMSMEKGSGWPDNFCSLLRSLFRSITAGKFEDSYKVLLPMIPTILNGMRRIFEATEDEPLRCIIIELSLTVPARLSSLLPHMPLLLRMIIPSLNSKKGDLINLGLRTLEFWIDNLNPEFLYPILAKQTTICTELMEALTSHLRPAPYSYGHLALRLLGKLGGKNRRFLREPVELPNGRAHTSAVSVVSMDCEWSLVEPVVLQDLLSKLENQADEKDNDSPLSGSFSIPLPIDTAVKVLKIAARINSGVSNAGADAKEDDEFETDLKRVPRCNMDMLWRKPADTIDLAAYCHDVVADTMTEQAKAAFNLLCSVLATVLDLDAAPPDLTKIAEVAKPSTDSSNEGSASRPSVSAATVNEEMDCLRAIVDGFLYSLSVKSLHEDSLTCLKGIFLYYIGVAASFEEHVVRIDANGSRLAPDGADVENEAKEDTNEFPEDGETEAKDDGPTKEAKGSGSPKTSPPVGKLGSLRPFGYFALTGPFERSNPFVLCEALAEMLSETCSLVQSQVGDFFEAMIKDSVAITSPSTDGIDVDKVNTAQLAFYESLLEALCRFAVTKPWNVVPGLRSAILTMMDLLGSEWAMLYEVELIQVAIASVKNTGKEIPFAGVRAFQFFVKVFVSLYGKPCSWEPITFIPDVLAIEARKTTKKDSDKNEEIKSTGKMAFPSDAVLNLLIVELASAKQLTRFTARYALKCHVFEGMTALEREKRLSKHLSTIKRVLFTRSLRLLPLPEQVAVIEALATLVDFAPDLLPVADQHLLAFLSEFLKLSSIADGEMTDATIVGFVVDKNGFTGKNSTSRYSQSSKHLTGIFLRRECVARLCSGKYILIPEELPMGVQLRVSALRLLNTVIRRHADGFFDADATTPIGNIRPHVISLLFRSLVSEPPMSVCAAHEALQDVLSLSVVTKDEAEGSRSQSRLPKELLQTCIRPVLLNLRDYTRLSVPLLRGLARLLSLLSSWFNKTLGEKLLEHLQKWTEPELIMACKIWRVGEEPIVAARILELFALLPHASHFVEPLVKTVIKLEAALHRFKGNQEESPYRKPLARYLNKQSQYTVSFFFQRLKNPMYNELFQDITALKESGTLRAYLRGRQCSVTLLNVCFERPLAIIRSEKTSASKSPGKSPGGTSAADIMSMHGITVDAGKQREALLRQDIDAKQKKLLLLQQETSRTKDALQARVSASSTGTESNDALEEAKRRHRMAQAALEKSQKELNESKQKYASEIAHPESADASSSTKKMSVDALELQHQGFKLVETLVEHNENYLTEHNDIVRAFRWLWRSKGRHLRLQHEELMPPRFHKESKLLGSLLVKYAKTCPSDVDVLFELLRIFLQPTTCDFGFIRTFLAETVSMLPLDKKKHVMHRFFSLLAGEGPEETKVLSIQVIVMPILLNTLPPAGERFVKPCSSAKPGGDVLKARDSPAADSATASSTTVKVDQEMKDDAAVVADSAENILVDAAMVKKFVQEVLLKNGIPALYGDRVRVELLRVSTLLIRSLPGLMEEHNKDIIKFSWGLLKSDDASCKSWAYLNVCNFIAAFDTPAKIILQVYVSLMRLHQHEGRACIRSGLSVLLPSVMSKLDQNEFEKLIEYTTRVIHEDGNNIPQLAHVWQTIVTHREIFVVHRTQFMSHMVNSLNRLGLPPNCPIENRALSLSIAALVLEWSDMQMSSKEASNEGDDIPSSPTKRVKSEEREVIVDGLGHPSSTNQSVAPACLDKRSVDDVANFLIRMKILLADTKSEANTQGLEETTGKLLTSVLRKWPSCSLHPVYFEKVVSMCVDEIAATRTAAKDIPEKKSREKSKPRKGSGKASKSASSKSNASHSTTGGRDENKSVSSTLLLACLDIFVELVTVAPENPFLTENSVVIKEILEPCFLRAGHRDGRNLRRKLRRFLVPLLTHELKKETRDSNVTMHVKVLLETFINNSITADSPPSPRSEGFPAMDTARREDRRQIEHKPFPTDDGRIGGSCLAFFSLDIIREICSIHPSFLESFLGSLVALLDKLVATHVLDVTQGQRQSGTTSLVGFSSSLHRQKPTPTFGIVEEASYALQEKPNGGKAAKPSDKSVWNKISHIGTSFRSIITCMNLIASSDLAFSFTRKRTMFMKTVGSILDASDNIQLLLTATAIAGNWVLVKDGSGPLACNERVTFLRKISSLDSRLISPVVAQPLADLVGCIVLALAEKGIANVVPFKARSTDIALSRELDAEMSQQCFDSTHTLFQRCLVTTIANANSTLRQKAMSLYGTQVSDVRQAIDSTMHADFYIPNRSLFDMMWQLFHTDFEGLSGRLWPIVFVEVLLWGSLVESRKIKTDSPWLPRPERLNGNSVEEGPPQQSVSSFFKLMSRHSASSGATKDSCLGAVLNLAHGSPDLVQNLFEQTMAFAWNHLGNDATRSLLIGPMERLLSRPYHAQGFDHGSDVANSIQSVLRAFEMLNPQPVLDSDVLVSLAGTYRAWHNVTSILENQFRILSSSGDSPVTERVWSGIRSCMQQLGEENLALSLTQTWSKHPETSYALSLDIHGMVKEAITSYTKLVDFAESVEDDAAFAATDVEMDYWEERWIKLQKEMCQLELVSEYGESKEDTLLLLQTAWKRQDWDRVSGLISSPAAIAMCERGDPTLKMSEILLAITKGKLSEVENLHAQTAQLCLQQWQLLPNVTTGSQCHSALLHFFHRLVEFRESGQIMVETVNHSNRRTLPDLQNLLSAWRHRLPNDYDNIADWDDVIAWRTHMFSSITSNFQWSEAGTLSTLHDRPWTVIRMAKTARKQGMRDVAMLSLSRITDSSMDVSDAFSKLREQILTFNNPESDLERTGGLNLVNSTNLSFFDPSQKSELFRLKAQFLSSLGGRSKANQAYCHAVQVCPSYARAWVSWGGLCSSLGRLAEKQQHEQQTEVSGDKENPNAKKVAQYLAQAMGCYLEAVNCDTDDWCRIHLPKCLWMLAKDGSTPGVLSQTLETRGAALPCWVWLPWCPQLLTSLYRNEGKAAKAILTTLAKTYPQALYFPLRAFYLERRDVERSKGGSSGSHQGSVVHSEELMSSLRRAHASLWSSLEAILEELIVKFRPSYEEELLATMTALLDRAETQIESSLYSTKDNSDDEEAVVASISKTLGRISTKFFRETAPETASNKRDERARKTETFKLKYKSQFEADFLTLTAKSGDAKESEEKALGLNDFLDRLRKWKKLLQDQVSGTPKSLPLVESSLSLALFSTEAPDLWPMSCDPRAGSALFENEKTKEDKPNPSSTSASAQAARTAAITAALAVASAAAREGRGGEYGGGSSSIEIPGQYVPNAISAVDSKPSPELHAKLVRFEPRVEVVRRNDQLIRRIGMIGSDGRRYQFLLQFAIPYWTRTDERTVQLCYLFDKVFRRDATCARNFLSIQPSPVIPIAQRLRMTFEAAGRLSLHDVFRSRCEEAGCGMDVIANYRQSRVKKLLDASTTAETSPEETKKLLAAKNMEVLREICEKKVDGTILLDYIQRKLASAEALFHFRRTFAAQLAINSLMQHAFSVVVRNPSRVVMKETSGQVFSPEFRLSYNNQGFLESQKVPFRMTQNLREMIGPMMMEGRFVPSMAMTATAIKANMEDIDAILRLLVRDDIMSWYFSKSMAKSDSKTQELEKQLVDRVAKNVSLIQSKISECATKKVPKTLEKLPTQPVDQRVRNLLAAATSFERLSTMESSFQPWL